MFCCKSNQKVNTESHGIQLTNTGNLIASSKDIDTSAKQATCRFRQSKDFRLQIRYKVKYAIEFFDKIGEIHFQ